jgi:hypothetical protein
MNIKYQDVEKVHGANAPVIADKICVIHGGMSLFDFKSHRGGLDCSGCSDADKAKIAALMKAEEPKKKDS